VTDLRDRQDAARSAIRNRFETRDIEFAESHPFAVLRWKVIEGAMAMANLRDGGRIVVGVSQREGHFELSGIEAGHLNTYDPDDVLEAVNKYARPPVEAAIFTVEEEGHKFLVIDVAPFKRSPVVCTKSAPDNSGRKFKGGDVFARTAGRVSTTRIVDADLMEEIVEIAAEKRAGEIIATAQRIGLRMPASDQEAFAKERTAFGDPGDLR
jgi:predicted HTH transcriptional regulator